MGTAASRGQRFKEKTRVHGKKPIGAASFRQQSIQALCHPLARTTPFCHNSTRCGFCRILGL